MLYDSKECSECGRTVEQLAKMEIELRRDGVCEKCNRKLMHLWKQEKREMEKYWRDTRL